MLVPSHSAFIINSHVFKYAAVTQDEAQQDDEQRLEREIHGVYVHKFHLVLTSRYMGKRYESPEFERFRKVRVRELSSKQQKEVVLQRLSSPDQTESRERFLKQIETNSALNEMARNPLLLNLVESPTYLLLAILDVILNIYMPSLLPRRA
jgi:hypothetical protein